MERLTSYFPESSECWLKVRLLTKVVDCATLIEAFGRNVHSRGVVWSLGMQSIPSRDTVSGSAESLNTMAQCFAVVAASELLAGSESGEKSLSPGRSRDIDPVWSSHFRWLADRQQCGGAYRARSSSTTTRMSKKCKPSRPRPRTLGRE